MALQDLHQSLLTDGQRAGIQAPTSTTLLLRFIARLHIRGFSAASIRSKLSAISYWHQLHDWANPTASFLVKKALIGVNNLSPPSTPSRGPITPTMLHAIVQAIEHVGLGEFEKLLF